MDDISTTANEWLRFAQNDMGVAEHLLKNYFPKPLEIICFHCQQAVEKGIKAVILYKGSPGGMPRSHDILLLLNQIKNMVQIPERFFSYSDILRPYGIVMRYPSELFLEERDAKEAVQMAQDILTWAENLINQ